MRTVLERTSSGAAWNFPSEYFSVENCLSKKSKVVLCEVMTNLSTRLQSVAGGLEIQLGNLWTVSLRGCHRRALWPHSAPVLGLPCEGHFSQSTMVTWLPRCMALSQQERGPCCTMRDVGQPGMSAHREQQGHKAYQLQLPQGSISELKWRALGQRFSLFGEISIFSMGKENKNTIILIIIKKEQFSAHIYPVRVWEIPRTEFLLREFFQEP